MVITVSKECEGHTNIRVQNMTGGDDGWWEMGVGG